jgi:hypothetical protein
MTRTLTFTVADISSNTNNSLHTAAIKVPIRVSNLPHNSPNKARMHRTKLRTSREATIQPTQMPKLKAIEA